MNSKRGCLNKVEVELAQSVRNACVRTAKKAFEDASISGLCDEGAWEAAIGAIEMLDIETLIREASED